MLDFFRTIELTDIGPLNIVLQVLLFEIVVFLAVPTVGILTDLIIVRGVRSVFARMLGMRTEYILSNYVLFIGVVIHECSHALFAAITGAKVVKIVFFRPEGDRLGYVTFVARGNAFSMALQNSFTACAPVVTGIILSILITVKLLPSLGLKWQIIAVLYVLVSIVFHMNMSSQDLKIYFSGTLPLLVIFFPICLLIMLFV